MKKIIPKKIVLLLFSLYLNPSLFAQKYTKEPNSTRNIRDIYEYVQNKITRNQYYLNEFTINTGGLKWSDAKDLKNIQKYYYSYVGDNLPSLRMVILNVKIGDKNYYTEYLYDTDGQLIFYYENQNDLGTYSYRELSAFFENTLCINLMLDNTIVDYKDKTYNEKLKSIQENGKFYANKFMEDMKKVPR